MKKVIGTMLVIGVMGIMYGIACQNAVFADPAEYGNSDVSVSMTDVTVENTIVEKLSIDEIKLILENAGYESVTIDAEVTESAKALSFKYDDMTYFLLVYPDGDIQLHFAFRCGNLTLEDINKWNRSKRLSRAYLDDEGDPHLEMGILANGGLTPRIVVETVNIFTKNMVPSFLLFTQLKTLL